jgi:RNA polymerase sigma factor (sigma-70 family)
MSPRPRPRLDPERDAALVQRCLEGDARAWDDLVRRYERLVYAIGISYHLEEADLGDCFQEVFGALVRGLPRLREPRALCRWLASTTDRVARAYALRIRRERAHRAADLYTDALAADQSAVGADLERLEQQALVRLAVADLPDRCRALLEALYYEDPAPAYAAVARRLGMPIGSLGPTRARCFERLRAILDERLDTGDRIKPAGAPTSLHETGRDRRPARRGHGAQRVMTSGEEPR